ncbi:hypothetical protein IMSHALPRED_006412 [Imshaugia aleurites]|uniref:Uncharacterized protein n=1 Tax=Imshaugia aleurites TaxID=172621 RepID=A0A8H3FFQ1_9LECA|nr:hypothetical protein IMSHALPRED_006412 [Imshaugia aleurites]
MNNTMDVTHVPIRLGSPPNAQIIAPMEIPILETRLFYNVQVTVETGAATTTGAHPTSNSNDFFPLSEGFPISGGTSVASISTTGPAVPSADIIGNPINGDTATTASSETSSTSSSTSPTPTPTSTTKNAGGGAAVQSPTSLVSVISVVSIVTSAANGDLITTTNMIMQTVPPTPTPSPSSSSSPHLGAEIGGAVAGALALIALISLAFLLLRRRKKKQQYHTAPTTEYRNSMDYMYKHNDTSSPRTAETSPEIDGTPIVGVYRGWGPEGGAALRVVNGSDHRQSGVSGLTGANGRESLMSELESPGSPGWGGGRGMERTMREQPFELAGEGGR